MSKKSQLCVVTIGLDAYILPMPDGLKLAALMAGACPVERLYGSSRAAWRFLSSPSGSPDVRLELVREDQIMSATASTRPLALTYDGSRS